MFMWHVTRVEKMKKNIYWVIGLFAIFQSANASIIFTFEDVGSDLMMTSSGTLNTNNLVLQDGISGWGGAGFGNFGVYAMIGGTTVGNIDISFGFNQGTDFSEWLVGSGPFTTTQFDPIVTGTTGFATYLQPDPYTPGISMESGDIVNGLWRPDQTWTFLGASIASYGMLEGTYTVSDSITAESITFQIGSASVPEPGSLVLLAIGLAGFGFAGKKKFQ